MPKEIKETPVAPPESEVKPVPPKPEKVKLKLTWAGSCNYEGIILKKYETIVLEASQAERLMQSGLFER